MDFFAANSCNLRIDDSGMVVDVKENNLAVINVYFNISNIGTEDITNVTLEGHIKFSSALTFNNISTSSPVISTTINKGKIDYNCNLGTIVPQDSESVNITFDVIGSESGGCFSINNVIVITDDQDDQLEFVASTPLNIYDIQSKSIFKKNKMLTILENNPYVPEGEFSVWVNLCIPNGITVEFKDFGVFEAKFIESRESVPLNEPVVGRSHIQFLANHLMLPKGSSLVLPVVFNIVKSEVLGKAWIQSNIKKIQLQDITSGLFINKTRQKSQMARQAIYLSIQPVNNQKKGGLKHDRCEAYK